MNYIVTDTETTGMEPTDEILEMALVWREADGLRTVDAFAKPDTAKISIEAMATHHITPEMLEDKESPSVVIPRLLVPHQPLDERQVYMVAHNAAFDRGFIGKLVPVLADPKRWICTYRCALHLWPEAPKHSNQALRYWLGLKPDLPEGLYPHRALYDTIVTELILRRMLETHTLEQLAAMQDRPALLHKMSFGKHRGKPWAEVAQDRGYLDWLLKQQDMDADVRHTALHYRSGGSRLL